MHLCHGKFGDINQKSMVKQIQFFDVVLSNFAIPETIGFQKFHAGRTNKIWPSPLIRVHRG